MIPIIIPSLGRAGTASTMKWLTTSRRIIFAVHSDEAEAYSKAYPNTEIMILSDTCRKHAGLVRKEIMIKHPSPFIFIDDDVRISFKTVTTPDEVFDKLEAHLASGASMAGLGQQLFSNHVMEKCILINDDLAVRDSFVAIVYAIRPTDFVDCPLEELPVYEDAALVLHAIQRGGVIVSYCATHSNVSPPEGGCNAWRDEAVTINCMLKMIELYPEYCELRDTENTTHSQKLGIGLRISWKKARRK